MTTTKPNLSEEQLKHLSKALYGSIFGYLCEKSYEFVWDKEFLSDIVSDLNEELDTPIPEDFNMDDLKLDEFNLVLKLGYQG